MKKLKITSAAALVALTVLMPTGAGAQVFGNDEPSCAAYADWIIDLMKKGRNAGCDFDNAREWFNPQKQVRWCMGQSQTTMRKAAATFRGHLKSRCDRRGIDARSIR